MTDRVFNSNDLLDLEQLCAEFGYKPQTIYNLICKKQLIRNIHYLQRGKRCKLTFLRSAFLRFLRGEYPIESKAPEKLSMKPEIPRTERKGAINI